MNAEDPDPLDNSPQSDEEGFDPTLPPKKRVRVPNSCVVCRKRKIKCNKGRPSCDQCSKRGVPHLCHYEDPRWMNILSDCSGPQVPQPIPRIINGSNNSNSNDAQTYADSGMINGIDELLLRLKHVTASVNLTQWLDDQQRKGEYGKSTLIPPPNREYNPNDKVKIVDNLPFLLPHIMRKSRIKMFGSLSPVYDLKTDPFLRIVWLHMWKYLDLSMQNNAGQSSDQDRSINLKAGYINRSSQQLLELRRRKDSYKKVADKLRNSGMPIDEIVTSHLPPKRTILSLTNRFFRFYHAFIPLLDEYQFIQQEIERIIGGWVFLNEPPSRIFVTSVQDYAHLGILFAIMAIAAMTLHEDEISANYDFRLITGKCTALYAIAAEKCLNHCHTLRKTAGSKSVLIAFLLNFYHRHSPESDPVSNGLSGDIEFGYVISMIRANGFHADPEDLGRKMNHHIPKKFGVWRRFWHMLMSMDASEAAVNGLLPRFTDDDSYDTQLPTYSSDLSPEEMFIVEDYQFMDKKTKLYRKACRTLYQRKSDPTIGQLLELADELKDFSSKELGSLKEILMKNLLPHARVKKLCYLIELATIEAGLRQRAIGYFHLHGNSLMLHKIFAQLIPLLTKLLNTALNISYNGSRYVGHAFVFYFRPLIVRATTRCMLSFATLLFRCVQCIKSIPFEDQSRLRAFRELQSTLLANMDRTSQLIHYTNLGYCSAQRMNLGFGFFVHMLKDPAFDFDKAKMEVTQRMMFQDELKRMLDMGNQGMAAVLPDENFMSNLLDTEVDALKANAESNIEEVLQPVIGERLLNIDTGENMFPSSGGPRPQHFATSEAFAPLSDDQRREGESRLHKTVSLKFMSQKVDSIFAGCDTIKTSNNMLTPRQLSGEEELTPGQMTSPELSVEQFGDLFGLLDDYNWIGAADMGMNVEGGGMDN